MAKLRVKTSDGKTLVVQVPEGTDPSQYDTLASNAVAHYTQTNAQAAANPETMEFERGPNYPSSNITTDAPSMDIAMAAEAAPKLAMALPGAIKAIPKVAGAAMDGAGALVDAAKGGVGKVGELVGDGLTSLKNQITGNTPRAFGYAQNAGATPEARQAAKDAMEFANNAQPAVGQAVGEAGGDASQFANPIKQGMFGTDPEAMLQTVGTQKAQVGKAIENTLGKYDGLDSFYNPSKVNDAVKGMLERDVNGEVMTTGFQGEVNQAMKDALSSLTDYSQGGPIKWSEAARIKGGMQGGAKYGQQGLSHAEAAYQKVAGLLKDDIDKQASEMLAKAGQPQDVAQYQQLRDAYGKLSGLEDSLNVAAKRKFANSAIPWWVKMGAGAAGATALGNVGSKIVHGLTGN